MPKVITWWIAFILGALGIIASLVNIAFLSTIAIWLLAIGWVLLVLGPLIKGL